MFIYIAAIAAAQWQVQVGLAFLQAVISCSHNKAGGRFHFHVKWRRLNDARKISDDDFAITDCHQAFVLFLHGNNQLK